VAPKRSTENAQIMVLIETLSTTAPLIIYGDEIFIIDEVTESKLRATRDSALPG